MVVEGRGGGGGDLGEGDGGAEEGDCEGGEEEGVEVGGEAVAGGWRGCCHGCCGEVGERGLFVVGSCGGRLVEGVWFG